MEVMFGGKMDAMSQQIRELDCGVLLGYHKLDVPLAKQLLFLPIHARSRQSVLSITEWC